MKKLNILIVEDEFLIALELETILKKNGHNIIGIANSWEQVRNFINYPDINLLLFDINLNGEFDGIEIAQKFNENRSIPTIFLSGISEKDFLAKTSNIKGLIEYRYIIKPFRDAEIIKMVNQPFNL